MEKGSAFAEHTTVDQVLDATRYFANPYCAWQRSCNENLNGLLRQYFPNGCGLAQFSEQDIARGARTQQPTAPAVRIQDTATPVPSFLLPFCTSDLNSPTPAPLMIADTSPFSSYS